MMSFNTTNVDLSGRNATFTGTVTADVVNATSDARLKSDFHDIEKPMEMINLMKGHYYTKGGRQEVGVIAQEIKGVLPEVVDDSGEFMAVAYGNLVAVLIEGMKAQDKRIAELEGKAFCTCE
jgi:hypothetical protein